MPTSKVWRFVTNDFTGGQTHDGLDIAKTIAAETRVGTTTMITQHITANCTDINPENLGAGPSPNS